MVIVIVLVLILSLVITTIALFIIFYNKFQVLKNGAETGLSQIDVALQKRLDLISQLVECVKNYAQFERNIMEKITELRCSIQKQKNPENIDSVNEKSIGILDKILMVLEGYPNLKTSTNVSDLMKSIIQVEDEIARLRYTYNNIVQDYNTRCKSFPSNIVAKFFSFSKIHYLKFEKSITIKPDMMWNNG